MNLEDFPWSEAEFALHLGAMGWFSFVAVVFRALGVVFAIVVAVVAALFTMVGVHKVFCLLGLGVRSRTG